MCNKLLLMLALLCAISSNASADIKRVRVENFSVEPGTPIRVKIDGGSIKVNIDPTAQVHIELTQVADTDSEKEADEMIAKAQAVIEKNTQGVRVLVHQEDRSWLWFGHHREVRFNVNMTVPEKVNLDLDTSGGSIHVNGELQGDLRADTSGGSINVTGGTGKMNLDTSGGGITVDRVLKQVHADTSGGSIHIGYVAPGVTDVNADTSGGGISIGLDPAGDYNLDADTSGGSVNVKNLAFNASKNDRTHAEGKINRGGARVRADTSGGSIDIYAAHP